jgi:hypothetical protein
MSELPVSPELWSVAEIGLDYGVHVAGEMKEAFQPALVTETADGGKTITQLFLALAGAEAGTDPLAAALSVLEQQDDVVRAAVVVDGYTHVDDVRDDAILVFVGERGSDESHEFAQRYRRSGLRKKFQTVGNIAYVGTRDPIFG